MGSQTYAGNNSVRLRTHFWEKLDRLLSALPRRNVLIFGGDLNAVLRPCGAHVGHGVHSTLRQQDDELLQILQVHDLCVLNTWKSARTNACTTFHHGEPRSQIDYVITRRVRSAGALFVPDLA